MAATSTLPRTKLLIDAPAPLRLWHLASLDAPTVAVVWTLAFGWAAHIQLPGWILLVLSLSAWAVYIGDRLLDARSAQGSPLARDRLRPRHYFHWEHRRLLVPLALAAAITAVVLVIHSMPLAARARNSVLAAAALAYFTSVHSPWRLPAPQFRLRIPKELLVGILFTLACAAPVWARMSPPRIAMVPTIPVFVAIFIALAWLNCYAIESWESTQGTLTKCTVMRPALALAGSALLLSAATAAFHQPRPAALLAAASVSAASIAVLDATRLRLMPTALRAAADLVLLTPLALLALSHWSR